VSSQKDGDAPLSVNEGERATGHMTPSSVSLVAASMSAARSAMVGPVKSYRSVTSTPNRSRMF
jgi:hypothetical protein